MWKHEKIYLRIYLRVGIPNIQRFDKRGGANGDD